ncbi:response regulator transcription factor [Amycolatopsis sp. lyj-346]|uniref:response regulator transcription factor n=1 Tax=Amycolatopsis sp. lyj-346 TaxID=2789289 RepID=UPI003979048B
MRLLIVEDEREFAETLRRGLVAEGFTADIAHTGREGLWRATEHEYDVVVLDIMLPELSGYEVLKRLRAAENWTPVLMLTAKDGEYDEADAFDLGADDYLSKPFSFVVLIARLRALLRRGAPARPAVLEAGDLRLDPAARTVHRGQKRIELTAREFGLLEFLLRRAGTALSKNEILSHVWDAHYDGDENVVEVYIGYLRRKIDAPFGTRTIETVRGVGYRLVDVTRS